MLSSLKIVDTGMLGFRYLPSEVDTFNRLVEDKIDRILNYGSFARAMDNRKIQEMLKQCDAKQIYDFHHGYTAVYSLPECRDDGLSGDAESLEELSGLLKELEIYEGYDRIQKKNIRDFAKDLDAIRSDLL